jgi:hypothetical protein
MQLQVVEVSRRGDGQNTRVRAYIGYPRSGMEREGRAAMTNHSEILRRWQLSYLNQRQQTLWAAAEAEVIGRRGCLLLASVTGITPQTILKRKCQFELTGMAQAGMLGGFRRL